MTARPTIQTTLVLTAAALVSLCASTAWAGYTNFDVQVHVPEQTTTGVPVDGPLVLDGVAVDQDYKPVYEDPPHDEWVRFEVRTSSGQTVDGDVEIEVTDVVEKSENVVDRKFELRWTPIEPLRADTTYEYAVETLREVHDHQSYDGPAVGNFRTRADGQPTGDTGIEADAGTRHDAGSSSTGGTTTSGGSTTSGGTTSGGTSEGGGTGGPSSSPDAGAAWTDAGSENGGSPTQTADENADRATCNQSGGARPDISLIALAFCLLTVALGRRRRT